MSIAFDLLHEYFYPNRSNDYLMHYGRSIDDGAPGPGSGRYPKGSGENPYQHDNSLLAEIRSLRKQGLTDKDIAERVCIYDKYGKPSAKALQRKYSVLQEQEKTGKIVKAKQLQKEGKSVAEIGDIMNAPWSTVKGWLQSEDANMSQNAKAAKILKQLADEKKYVDVSAGSELWLGMTKNRMENAEALLMEEGYSVHTIKVPQLGTNHMTTISVLTPPGIEYSDAVENRFNISPVFDETRILNQGEVTSLGLSRDKIHSISSDRVMINYNEEGGIESDGLIELRRGVDDISIGANSYCQVRIPVDDTHYIKGMAVYSDDLPPGIDVRFNTNKHLGTPMMGEKDHEVLKPMKTLDDGSVDWDNPFGASITAIKEYTDKDGKKQYSAACIVNEEGTWQKWDRNIPAQLGSKQPVATIKRQLDLDIADAKEEYDRICSLTNNTIKRKLLIEFADGCDQAAADLKAAPFPGQQTHVILPSSKIKDGEIYAPNYADGTKVACVRYPYQYNGEMNILTVRNTGSPGVDMIGKNAPDAVVLNAKAAHRMSGADFDGDTVSVIPLSSKVKLVNQKPIEGLDEFDPSEEYPAYPGMKRITSQGKQTEMGKATNLITDMTLKSANDADLAKAIRHALTIIDAEKHNLDYKRSEDENDIKELKKKYQDAGDGKTGAGTIVSRAGAEIDIPERKPWRAANNSIDPVTGQKIFQETGATYTKVKLKGTKERDPETGKMKTVYPEGADEHGWVGTYIDYKNGNQMYYSTKDSNTGKNVRHYITDDDITNSKIEKRTQKTDRMLTVDDAYKLTSGGSKEHPGYKHEQVYAEYANARKQLANQARLEWLRTDEGKKDPAAAKKYEEEVKSLDAKLNIAERYAPLERQAQLMGNRTMARKRAENPDMSKDREKKYKTQAINSARNALGVHRGDSLIDITDREWEAIQAHAIAPTKLRRILNNTDSDKLKQRATPRESHRITDNMKSLAKSMAAIGYTNAQIADRLGISPSSVSKALKE